MGFIRLKSFAEGCKGAMGDKWGHFQLKFSYVQQMMRSMEITKFHFYFVDSHVPKEVWERLTQVLGV